MCLHRVIALSVPHRLASAPLADLTAVHPLCCSISTVYKAVCAATQMSLIIKAYEKSKMKPKNLARLEREIHLMRRLGGGDGLVDLHAVFEDSAFKYLVSCLWPMSPEAIV